jgi:hypothetical protein
MNLPQPTDESAPPDGTRLPPELLASAGADDAAGDDGPARGTEGTRPGEGEAGPPLEEVSRREEDYVRQRLRGELGRDPTDAELSEWLRQHTEGY